MGSDPLSPWVNQGHNSPMTDRGSASVIQIDSGKLVPLVIVLALTAGLAIAIAVMSVVRANDAEREARMLQYYLLELDAKFINAGLKDPADAISKKLQQQRENAQ